MPRRNRKADAAEKQATEDFYRLTKRAPTDTDTERWWGPYWTAVPDAELYVRLTRARSGRWQMSGVVLLGETITSAQLRKVPVAAIENSANLSDQKLEGIRDLPALRRTPGMASSDFAQLVARHYLAWADRVPHPVPAMAAEAGVNRATVHSWVREARLRGLLPPGRERKTRAADTSAATTTTTTRGRRTR